MTSKSMASWTHLVTDIDGPAALLTNLAIVQSVFDSACISRNWYRVQLWPLPPQHTMKTRLHNECRLQTRPVLHNESVGQVQTLLALLEGVMLTLAATPEAKSATAYERHFMYCLAWSIGGLLDPKDRSPFDAQLRSLKTSALPQVWDIQKVHLAFNQGQLWMQCV